jgi:hypothetical protein
VNSPVLIAKTEPQESQIEKQPPGGQVNIAFAAHFLRTSPEDVLELCKAGMLLARRNRHGWRIDEASLIHWREAHTNTGAARCESNEGEEQCALQAPVVQPSEAAQAPCPTGSCSAHWERRGRIVPAFRVSLCRRCLLGRPLSVKED